MRVKPKHREMQTREREAASLTHDIKRLGNELHFRPVDRPCVHKSDLSRQSQNRRAVSHAASVIWHWQRKRGDLAISLLEAWRTPRVRRRLLDHRSGGQGQ